MKGMKVELINTKFRKSLLIIILLAIFVFFNTYFSTVYATEVPSVSAGSAILIDNRTNKVLFSKNADARMYPASTTKILTAILTLENGNLDDVVTASHDAVTSIPEGYSVADIQVGEQLTVEQLIEVLLVYSANDAANVLAEYVGGSIDSFVSMMNTKLNELGLNNSHFTNAYGRHDENHYTTATDLAKLMQYCIKNADFRRYAGIASCAIPATNMHDARLYNSTNLLVVPGNSFYTSYVTVGKTGFTSQAGDCLVSAGYNNDLELVCVVLNCPSSAGRFQDTINIYDYGYNNFSLKNIVNENDVVTQIEIKNATKDTKQLDVLSSETISALVNNADNIENIEPQINLKGDIKAPIMQGDSLGTVTYAVNGIEYTTDLVASHDVEAINIPIYLIIAFGIFVVLFVIYRIFYHAPKNYRRKNI